MSAWESLGKAQFRTPFMARGTACWRPERQTSVMTNSPFLLLGTEQVATSSAPSTSPRIIDRQGTGGLPPREGKDTGIVTPYGIQAEATLEALRDAKSDGRRLTKMDTAHRIQGSRKTARPATGRSCPGDSGHRLPPGQPVRGR